MADASATITALNSLASLASSTISSRTSSLSAIGDISTDKDLVAAYTTGVDFNYSDQQNASLSDVRAANRLAELSAFEQIIANNELGVRSLAIAREAAARRDNPNRANRITSPTDAIETARKTRLDVLSRFEERFGAIGALDTVQISKLLSDATNPYTSPRLPGEQNQTKGTKGTRSFKA